jgi:hypothetical protein
LSTISANYDKIPLSKRGYQIRDLACSTRLRGRISEVRSNSSATSMIRASVLAIVEPAELRRLTVLPLQRRVQPRTTPPRRAARAPSPPPPAPADAAAGAVSVAPPPCTPESDRIDDRPTSSRLDHTRPVGTLAFLRGSGAAPPRKTTQNGERRGGPSPPRNRSPLANRSIPIQRQGDGLVRAPGWP